MAPVAFIPYNNWTEFLERVYLNPTHAFSQKYNKDAANYELKFILSSFSDALSRAGAQILWTFHPRF